MPKLGILAISDADSIDVMMEGLRALGWVDGKTMEVVYPKATQDLAAVARNMRQLLDAHVDLIVAQTKPAVMIAKQATNDIPVVMGAFNGDPVKDGLVKSVEHPGTNVTGTYYNITSGAGTGSASWSSSCRRCGMSESSSIRTARPPSSCSASSRPPRGSVD